MAKDPIPEMRALGEAVAAQMLAEGYSEDEVATVLEEALEEATSDTLAAIARMNIKIVK